METLRECPACQSGHVKFSRQISDHFKSGEIFRIFSCYSCGLMFTNPRPDPNESVAYYKSDEYISHSNKSSGFFARVYQVARRRNLRWKLSQVAAHVTSGRLIDIGCGTAEFPAFMRDNGWQVTGIEPDEGARGLALSNHGLAVFEEDKLDLLNDGEFDAVTMWHVLEHVHHLPERIATINRVLQPGSYAFIALPNPSSFDATHYGEHWAGWDVPRHLYHFPPSTVISLFSDSGLRHIASVPMKLDSFYISILSERYLGSTFSMFRGLLFGLLSNLRAKNDPHRFSSTLYIFRKPQVVN